MGSQPRPYTLLNSLGPSRGTRRATMAAMPLARLPAAHFSRAPIRLLVVVSLLLAFSFHPAGAGIPAATQLASVAEPLASTHSVIVTQPVLVTQPVTVTRPSSRHRLFLRVGPSDKDEGDYSEGDSASPETEGGDGTDYFSTDAAASTAADFEPLNFEPLNLDSGDSTQPWSDNSDGSDGSGDGSSDGGISGSRLGDGDGDGDEMDDFPHYAVFGFFALCATLVLLLPLALRQVLASSAHLAAATARDYSEACAEALNHALVAYTAAQVALFTALFLPPALVFDALALLRNACRPRRAGHLSYFIPPFFRAFVRPWLALLCGGVPRAVGGEGGGDGENGEGGEGEGAEEGMVFLGPMTAEELAALPQVVYGGEGCGGDQWQQQEQQEQKEEEEGGVDCVTDCTDGDCTEGLIKRRLPGGPVGSSSEGGDRRLALGAAAERGAAEGGAGNVVRAGEEGEGGGSSGEEGAEVALEGGEGEEQQPLVAAAAAAVPVGAAARAGTAGGGAGRGGLGRKVVRTESGEEDPCTICFDGFKSGDQLRILPCQHRFHTACIDEWLMKKPLCPLCKRCARPPPPAIMRTHRMFLWLLSHTAAWDFSQAGGLMGMLWMATLLLYVMHVGSD
ncbi:unnamed protein product [Closterium sp. Yama58-4]|nr:unnamed protein product [Closterium sp. Yama58-4]